MTVAAAAELAARLRCSDSILFITGAGISADSGLPTYRGIGGLYDDRTTDEGVPIEVALSGPMFQADPALTWKYLWEIGQACQGAEPNDAHRFIAELQESRAVRVMTQNVDGLHRRAGTRDLIEVHGDASRLLCTGCGARSSAEEVIDGYRGRVALPPRCAGCGGVLRPRVVLFEEMLPDEVLLAFRELAETLFDLVVVIGTTAVFPYIQLPVAAALSRGLPVVEINPQATELSPLMTQHLQQGAAPALRAVREHLGMDPRPVREAAPPAAGELEDGSDPR